MEEDLIIIKGYNEVHYYNKGVLKVKTIDKFFSDMEEKIRRTDNVSFVKDEDTNEYYYDNKKIVFNNEQKQELNNPNSEFSKRINNLLKLSKEKQVYKAVLERGDFNNTDEAFSFIKFSESRLSFNSKSYRTDKNRINAAKEYLVNNANDNIEEYKEYFSERLKLVKKDFLDSVRIGLYVIFFILLNINTLKTAIPNIFTAQFFGSILKCLLLIPATALEGLFMGILVYYFIKKEFFKDITENREQLNILEKKSLEMEESKELELLPEDIKFEEKDKDKDKDYISDPVIKDLYDIKATAIAVLEEKDAYDICFIADDIADEYKTRMKKIKEDGLSLDNELKIKKDMFVRIRILVNDFNDRLNKKSVIDIEVEKLKSMNVSPLEDNEGYARRLGKNQI